MQLRTPNQKASFVVCYDPIGWSKTEIHLCGSVFDQFAYENSFIYLIKK